MRAQNRARSGRRACVLKARRLSMRRALFGAGGMGGMRGAKQVAAAAKKAAPAPAPAQRTKRQSLLASSDEDEAGEPGPSPSTGSDGRDSHEGAPAPPSLWALKGALAGRAAADASRAQRPYSVDPPPAVTAAGEAAELQWLVAFDDKFKSSVTPPIEDRLVIGLVNKKKRRRQGATEPNKEGIAGLKESAAPEVSVAVYAMVRDEFFLPDDHAKAAVRDHLAQDGFKFTDDDFSTWWEELGHAIVLHKCKTARHSLVDSVKQSVWRIHSACHTSQPTRRT